MSADRIIQAPAVTRVVRGAEARTRSVQGLAALGSAAVMDAGAADDQLATSLAMRTRGQMVNWQPNSELGLHTALPVVAKLLPDLSGPMPVINVTGYTTGSNTIVVTTMGLGALKLDDLVCFGSGAHAYLRFAAPISGAPTVGYRVKAISGATCTITLPYGLAIPSGASAACTAQAVVRGCAAGVSLDAADWTAKSLSLSYQPNDDPVSQIGGSRIVGVYTKGSDSPEFVYYDATWPPDGQFGANTRRLSRFWVQDLVRGQRVRCPSGAGSATPFIYQGIGGAAVSTLGPTVSGSALSAADGAWLETTTTIARGATVCQMGVQLTGPSGTKFIVAQGMSANGRLIGDGGYVPYRGWMRLRTDVVPSTLFGAGFSWPTAVEAPGVPYYGFEVDAYAESIGAYRDCEALDVRLEGASRDIGGVPLFTRMSLQAPHVYGPGAYTPSAGVNGTAGGVWPLSADRGRLYTSVAGAGQVMEYVSLDVTGALVGGEG